MRDASIDYNVDFINLTKNDSETKCYTANGY